MGEDDQQQSRLFYELCAFALLLVCSPHIFFPSVGASSLCGTSQRSEISPASLASLFLGASLALMLCGSITFVLGCILMPWVIGFGILFYFLGFVSSYLKLARRSSSPTEPALGRTATKEDPGHISLSNGSL